MAWETTSGWDRLLSLLFSFFLLSYGAKEKHRPHWRDLSRRRFLPGNLLFSFLSSSSSTVGLRRRLQDRGFRIGISIPLPSPPLSLSFFYDDSRRWQKVALHEQARESFLGFVQGGEFDVPEFLFFLRFPPFLLLLSLFAFPHVASTRELRRRWRFPGPWKGVRFLLFSFLFPFLRSARREWTQESFKGHAFSFFFSSPTPYSASMGEGMGAGEGEEMDCRSKVISGWDKSFFFPLPPPFL